MVRFFKILFSILCTLTISLSCMNQHNHSNKISLNFLLDNIHQCACGLVIDNYLDMAQHIEKDHKYNLHRYKCPSCLYFPATVHSLMLHFSVHTKENIFKCSICDFSNSELEKIKKHIKQHFQFAQEFAFLTQFSSCCKRKTDDRAECPQPSCSKTFTHIKMLLIHIRIDHLGNHYNPYQKDTIPPLLLEPDIYCTYTIKDHVNGDLLAEKLPSLEYYKNATPCQNKNGLPSIPSLLNFDAIE